MDLKLLENGLCFIFQSIKHFEQSEKDESNREKELKYSTIFLGIHLILKERLNKEHWSLLFSDTNKADKKFLKSGNFHGVNFLDCQTRLSGIVSIKLTRSQKRMLSSLKEKRNKLEHFFEEESLVSFKSVLAISLNFIIDFIDKYLDPNSSIKKEEYKKIYEQIKNQCFSLKTFREQRLLSIKPELKKQEVILYCSECNNNSMIPIDSKVMGVKCLFCLRFFDSNKYNELFEDLNIISPKDYYSISNTFCYECEAENSLVETKNNKYFCLCCHQSSKVDYCNSCGVTYSKVGDDEEDDIFCPNCWDDKFSKG